VPSNIIEVFLKVYITGAHASGKTTLARYVAKQYHLPMIPEVARMVLSEKQMYLDTLRYDLDQVDDYQRQVFHRQLEEERRHSSHFVSDRSFLDSLAYAAQHTRILSELMTDPKIEEHLPILQDKSSYVFFVRPCQATLKADGVRETPSWEGVVAIDAMIKLLLQMWKIRHFTINMDNMQERISLIDNVLNIC
jgi:nicotinamide riboside kinase